MSNSVALVVFTRCQRLARPVAHGSLRPRILAVVERFPDFAQIELRVGLLPGGRQAIERRCIQQDAVTELGNPACCGGLTIRVDNGLAISRVDRLLEGLEIAQFLRCLLRLTLPLRLFLTFRSQLLLFRLLRPLVYLEHPATEVGLT